MKIRPQRGRTIVRFVAPLQGANGFMFTSQGFREYAPPLATLFTPVGGKTQTKSKTAIPVRFQYKKGRVRTLRLCVFARNNYRYS